MKRPYRENYKVIAVSLSFFLLASCGRIEGSTADSGLGIAGYLASYTGANTLTSSPVFTDGTSVGVHTTSPAYTLDVNGRVNTSLGYYVGGVTLLNWFTAQTNMNFDGTNVGIGTNAPAATLDVSQTTAGSVALTGEDGGTIFWKVLRPAGGITATYNAAAAVEYVAKDTGTLRSINAAGTINAAGADFAEWVYWDSANRPEMGSIIRFKGSNVVVSSPATAAFVGNDREDPNHSILIAFAGQVPVLVRGRVREGDLIIGNGDGTGRAVSRTEMDVESMGNIVGTAWETSNDFGLKRVNVAVGIGVGGIQIQEIAKLKAAAIEAGVKIAKLEKENSEIKARLEKLEKLSR